MRQIYVVRDSQTIILACEDKQDARAVVESMYGKSAKAMDEHIVKIPLAENSIQVIDHNTKSEILDISANIACQIAYTLLEGDIRDVKHE